MRWPWTVWRERFEREQLDHKDTQGFLAIARVDLKQMQADNASLSQTLKESSNDWSARDKECRAEIERLREQLRVARTESETFRIEARRAEEAAHAEQERLRSKITRALRKLSQAKTQEARLVRALREGDRRYHDLVVKVTTPQEVPRARFETQQPTAEERARIAFSKESKERLKNALIDLGKEKGVTISEADAMTEATRMFEEAEYLAPEPA